MISAMMMKDAKKKALGELIKKMRGMEAKDLDVDLEEMGEAKDKPKRFDEGTEDLVDGTSPLDHYAEDEDDEGEELVNEEGESAEDEILDAKKLMDEEKKRFMKGSGKLAIKGPTKTVMVAIKSKPMMKKKM
jgi:hypothetical protein